MNGKAKAIGAAGIIALAASILPIWGFVSKVFEDMVDRRIQQQRNLERLNELEGRVCELEGGRYWQGDCLPKP